jgi:hypothetical protein
MGRAHEVAPQQQSKAHAEGGQLFRVLQVERAADGIQRHLLVDLFERHEAQRHGGGLRSRGARCQQGNLGLQRRFERAGGQVDERVIVALEEIAGFDPAHDGAGIGASCSKVEQD